MQQQQQQHAGDSALPSGVRVVARCASCNCCPQHGLHAASMTMSSLVHTLDRVHRPTSNEEQEDASTLCSSCLHVDTQAGSIRVAAAGMTPHSYKFDHVLDSAAYQVCSHLPCSHCSTPVQLKRRIYYCMAEVAQAQLFRAQRRVLQ